jgi:hypothetical protein
MAGGPSLHIVVVFEGAPKLYADMLTEGEYLRMRDWLAGKEELLAFLAEAVRLADEGQGE